MNNISWQDIRKVIVDFLQQRLANNSSYKSEQAKLEKAKQIGDQKAVNESQQKMLELSKRFDFETWMEDAATRRYSWIIITTHLSKGIHPSSKGSNANYNTQIKPDVYNNFVSSATIDKLPFDATGGASALDIFGLLKQVVKDDITILQLIINRHPEVKKALSDDENKATIYLENFSKFLNDNWSKPQASELNKQLYWPNSEESYLSQKEDNYRLLIPLHPSSLCHLVYQKVQARFSEENKQAREQRRIKNIEHKSYISFHDLAVVKLGGSNAQNASQLIGSQMGRNFLLASMPPQFSKTSYPSLSNEQETIFNRSLQYYCRFGFKLLFETINAEKNDFSRRNNRRESFFLILTMIFKYVKHLQTSKYAGWSRESSLKLEQQLWLDPSRANLDGEEKFKQEYDRADWQVNLEKDFAFWIQTILKDKFGQISEQFSDPEFEKWRREFRFVLKSNKPRGRRIN